MNDGQHIIYCIELRHVAEGKWLDLDSPIEPVEKPSAWATMNPDYFSLGTSDIRHDFSRVRGAAGLSGFYNLDNAKIVIKDIREKNSKGSLDSKDCYGTIHQKRRGEFRITKQVLSKHTEIIKE